MTLPATSAINAGWTIAIASDNGKVAAVQVSGRRRRQILFPGQRRDDRPRCSSPPAITNWRRCNSTAPISACAGDAGDRRRRSACRAAAARAKWNFPSVSSYTATPPIAARSISAYNSPISSLTVTLPSTTAIAAGWSMGFTTDNGKIADRAGQWHQRRQILVPGTRGAQSSLTLYGQNYEYAEARIRRLELPGRLGDAGSASANGMFPATGTPASIDAACQTGQVEADSNYLYVCTAPNTWKRAAWSSF